MRRFGAHLMSAEQEPVFWPRFVTFFRQRFRSIADIAEFAASPAAIEPI
jgi:hypothetical protein